MQTARDGESGQDVARICAYCAHQGLGSKLGIGRNRCRGSLFEWVRASACALSLGVKMSRLAAAVGGSACRR